MSDEDKSSWRELRSIHREDMLLRKHGFRIAHRRPGEEPVWELLGQLYTQSQAWEMAEQWKEANEKG